MIKVGNLWINLSLVKDAEHAIYIDGSRLVLMYLDGGTRVIYGDDVPVVIAVLDRLVEVNRERLAAVG